MSNDAQICNQVIALAALAQAIRSVQLLAWKGNCNDNDLKAVIGSLLKVDAPSAAAIYGGSFELSTGLRFLVRQIDTQDLEKDPEFVNLAINLITLQHRLQKDQVMLRKLGEKIDALSIEYQQLDMDNDDAGFQRLLRSCSDIYQQTLSLMPLRIQVRGEPVNLQRQEIQERVRAALLAAVRAVFLWRQSGGHRWHFLFKKKALIKALRAVIANPIRE